MFLSCNDKTAEPVAGSAKDTNNAEAPKEKPVFAYPVRYNDWEIGNPENTKTVIDFYYAWDRKDINKLVSLFSDTVRLRIPTERDEVVVAKNKIHDAFIRNRGQYDSTSNTILSAVSLHDKESKEDWVMITTYNKWREKDGTRDSVRYHDNWKLTNGKIDFLMSFYKLPSKQFIKRNDPKK